MILDICFATDDRYVQHLGVCITSILLNSKTTDEFNFYILDGGILNRNIKKLQELKKIKKFNIKFIKIDDKIFKNCPITKEALHINSLSTYYRFILPSLINLDKILYLDCDLVVKSSLEELYQTDIKESYFAGVEDILYEENAKRLKLEKYCNAGVLLLNLKMLREENMQENLFDWTLKNQEKIIWQDQDVINVVLQKKIKYIDKKWNCQVIEIPAGSGAEFNALAPKAFIVHYVGYLKPWHSKSKNKLNNEYFKYLLKTPWRFYLVKHLVKKLPLARKLYGHYKSIFKKVKPI